MVALPTLDVLLDWANIAIWLGDGKFSRAALSMTFCLATNVVTWREERAAWLQEARGQELDGVSAEAQPRWRDAVQLTGLGMALTAVDMVRAMRRGVLPTPAQRRHVMRLKLVEVSVEAGTQMVLQLCETGWQLSVFKLPRRLRATVCNYVFNLTSRHCAESSILQFGFIALEAKSE